MFRVLPTHDAGLSRAVVDSLAYAAVVVDREGILHAFNEPWLRLLKDVGIDPAGHRVGMRYADAFSGATGRAGPDWSAGIAAAVEDLLDRSPSEHTLERSTRIRVPRRQLNLRLTRLAAGGWDQVLLVHEEVTSREQEEDVLLRSERRFRSLIENASDLITILDETGVIRYESPSVARILGYGAAQRLDRSLFDFVHGHDLPDVLLAFTRALANPGENLSIEFRCLHRDQTWRILEGTAKNLLRDPAVSGIVLNAREISERKRAEEAQSRLTAVMDATPDLVCTLDPHGRVSYMNRAGRRILGLREAADTLRVNLNDLHPPWANERIMNHGLPTAMREGVWAGESALNDHSGQEIPVLQVILAHRDAEGAVQFFSTTARDISERKQAEEALRQSDEVLRQIAENINEALWIYDAREKRPIYVSPGYERIWGRPLEEAYGDPDSLLASLGPAAVLAPRPTHAGAPDEVEFTLQRADGSRRWLRSRAFPVHDTSGGVARIVGLTEDVTERKQIENELRRAQRLEAIGHLAGGIAHEINTPIQYIRDNVTFLREGLSNLLLFVSRYEAAFQASPGGAAVTPLFDDLAAARDELDIDYVSEAAVDAATHALEGLERIGEIVRAMKEFSQPVTSEKVLTDLNQAMQNTVTVARNEWKHIADLTADLDPVLPLVPCLPGELNQAMLNLLMNATEAIAEMCGAGERGTIHISTRRVGEWAEIRIRDSGTGIPEAVRPRIFDAFFTTKDVGRGTGQGLTLAHATVVEKHGGTITFDTELGAGTTFIVRLPLPADRQSADPLSS